MIQLHFHLEINLNHASTLHLLFMYFYILSRAFYKYLLGQSYRTRIARIFIIQKRTSEYQGFSLLDNNHIIIILIYQDYPDSLKDICETSYCLYLKASMHTIIVWRRHRWYIICQCVWVCDFTKFLAFQFSHNVDRGFFYMM